jgi:hypothetical protein
MAKAKPTAKRKDAGPIYVDVTVRSGVIHVTPDPVPVPSTFKNVAIVWVISTAGWIFPEYDDGVVLKIGTIGEFSNGHRRENDPACFVLHNKNSLARTHPYTINVQKADGTYPMHLDPTIKNEG